MGQGIQVQAQTHNKLQNVDDGSGNPSTSTDTQQTVQNVGCVSVLVLGFPDPSSTFCSLLCVCACTWIP
jgi:hypothetical protein